MMNLKRKKRQLIRRSNLNDLLDEELVADYAITNLKERQFIDRVYSINKWVSFIADEGQSLRGIKYFASLIDADSSIKTVEEQEAHMLRYDYLKQMCPRMVYCNNPEFLDAANFIIQSNSNSPRLPKFVTFVEGVLEIGEQNPMTRDLKYSEDEVKEGMAIVKETIKTIGGKALLRKPNL